MEFYNEIDPYAAAWLRNLSSAGHIGAGAVNETDIRKLTPRGFDLFDRCHFFAGIGVWSYALRVAGWPDAWPVWTGSCPCQPFSGAGKRSGFDDERHLWPDWFRLIEAERPFAILGEQVASKDGYAWLDLVQTDLENAGYTFGAVISPVAGFGAPHWRHRIYWLAYADHARPQRRCERRNGPGECITRPHGVVGGLAYDADQRREWGRSGETSLNGAARIEPERFCDAGGLGNTNGRHSGAEWKQRSGEHGQQPKNASVDDRHSSTGPVNGFWRASDWLRCTDGKWRPVESGTFPLVNGAPGRVGKLRAYGNAICAPQAIEFCRTAIEVIRERYEQNQSQFS